MARDKIRSLHESGLLGSLRRGQARWCSEEVTVSITPGQPAKRSIKTYSALRILSSGSIVVRPTQMRLSNRLLHNRSPLRSPSPRFLPIHLPPLRLSTASRPAFDPLWSSNIH